MSWTLAGFVWFCSIQDILKALNVLRDEFSKGFHFFFVKACRRHWRTLKKHKTSNFPENNKVIPEKLFSSSKEDRSLWEGFNMPSLSLLLNFEIDFELIVEIIKQKNPRQVKTENLLEFEFFVISNVLFMLKE